MNDPAAPSERLFCPRCKARTNDAAMGPFRRSARPDGFEEPLALERRVHASGAELFACGGCGGHFVPYEGMLRLEAAGRGKSSAAEMARRAFAPPSEPIACARCGEATTRRTWGVVGTTYVDVCTDFDCRGVWLDKGELEAIAGKT